MRFLQAILLFLYQWALSLGLLKLPVFRRFFFHAYFLYKKLFEDPLGYLTKAHPNLFRGGDVLDVGANIGFTCALLASAVDSDRKVYAFEPSSDNFLYLNENLSRLGLNDKIRAVRTAVGDTSGSIKLKLNLGNHADHRVDLSSVQERDNSEEVSMVSLDNYCKEQNLKRIAFVKIDVQGFEPKVIRGMSKLIEDNSQLSILFEFFPDGFAQYGENGERLLTDLTGLGLKLYLLERSRILELNSNCELIELAQRRGYVDIIATRADLCPR